MSATSDLFNLLEKIKDIAIKREWILITDSKTILASPDRMEIVIGRYGIFNYAIELDIFEKRYSTLKLIEVYKAMDNYLMEYIRNGIDNVEWKGYKIAFYPTSSAYDSYTQTKDSIFLRNTFII